MKYEIIYTKKFAKSLKNLRKRGLPLEKLLRIIDILQDCGAIPDIYRPHKLHGDFEGCWECHIMADWLLIWAIDTDNKTLKLVDTGSHSDLF